ncbi:hypothetical protein GCM10022232_63960 [Streptomyces plumbiresistens]|uniref:Transposase n=1 Tax=Streptomyces plumbiresistens TaxID=511811 RepID=A0ABP7SKP8_9ACTN
MITRGSCLSCHRACSSHCGTSSRRCCPSTSTPTRSASHNPRIPDRVVFDHIIAALVHGSGYERIAGTGCSDRTIRHRLEYWAQRGTAEQIHAPALQHTTA